MGEKFGRIFTINPINQQHCPHDHKNGANHPPRQLDADKMAKARELFDSYRLDDDGCIKVIAEMFERTEELLDPHTAIGVKAAEVCRRDAETPMVALATAHPVKFPEPVVSAGCKAPELPHHLEDLFEREERYQVLGNDLAAVHAYVAEQLG